MKNTLILVAIVLVWLFALPGFVQAMPDLTQYQNPRVMQTDTGESIFQTYCGGCHGNDAKGALGPNIIGKKAQQITFAKAHILPMQGFELTPEEVTAVEGYLASLAPPAGSNRDNVGITGVTLEGFAISSALAVDFSGRSQNEASLQNINGGLVLDIPSGTVMKSAAGNPLSSISVRAVKLLAEVTAQKKVIKAYDLEPYGATFAPAITLTLSYDEAMFPVGALDKDLLMAYWDGSEWTILETTVNAGTKTVAAKITRFSIFGILSEPADPPGVSQPATIPPISSPAPATPIVSPPVTQRETEATPARFDDIVITGIIAGVVALAITIFIVARNKIFAK